MKKILVGIDGSARGARALHWAARRASREGANLELLSVVDSRKVKEAGASIEDVQEAVEANLDKARNFVAKRYSNVQVEMRIAEGEVVENIVDASVGCDLIVLGSHHRRCEAFARCCFSGCSHGGYSGRLGGGLRR